MSKTQTPSADGSTAEGQPNSPVGFRMPAEWESHAATWMTWPRPEGVSFPGHFTEILPVLARLACVIARDEELCINVWDEAMEQTAQAFLEAEGALIKRISFHRFPAHEPWCRDHGPIFVVRDAGETRRRAIIDWDYNAWGEKYPPFDLDNQIPRCVAFLRGLPRFVPDMVLEGGSIDVDGRRTLLTTKPCLLHPNRNPGLSQADIEQRLRNFLGVEKILWLGGTIAGDDTDGHIDCVARFVAPGTVVAAVEDNPADENHSPLRENWELLRSMTDAEGMPLKVFELPMPRPVVFESRRLPASYTNFYISNNCVIVPTFRDPNDDRALAILRETFQGRRVIGLDSAALIWGLGSFHCLTQQEPASEIPTRSKSNAGCP